MINVLGLCRYLRELYPIPHSPTKINQSILDFLGHEAPKNSHLDVVRALAAKWKREGWMWDLAGAVKLDSSEEALFHSQGVSVIIPCQDNPATIKYYVVKTGDQHPKVVWF